MHGKEVKDLLEKVCCEITVYTPATGSGEAHCSDCPKGKEGLCHRCEQFMGFFTKDPNGRMIPHETYTGYCLNENEDKEHIKTELHNLIANQVTQEMLKEMENAK